MHTILHKNDVPPFLQYMTDVISGAGIAVPSGALNLIQFYCGSLYLVFVVSYLIVVKKTSFFS